MRRSESRLNYQDVMVIHSFWSCLFQSLQMQHIATGWLSEPGGYIKDLYQVPGIAETIDIDHIRAHYYASHAHINPTAVIPKGPKLDYSTAHGRENTGNPAVWYVSRMTPFHWKIETIQVHLNVWIRDKKTKSRTHPYGIVK